ncbi:hypothetical protein L6164_014280 [Bauhinia variegata]|uniref:Uncharacterized protein n=1 Tax=Bauhinia variegata TaxID=167791 RepID=A0ACB9NIH0_BAUVA|nr:hypothetical protein L6164_014280 [Bauhinia variegata]
MAETPAPVELSEVVRCVQELLLDTENLPESYVYKEGGPGFHDALVPSQDIPVLDIGLLKSPATAEQELKKLHSVLTTWGYFQAINHGMTSSFLDKVREISKQFFELPKEEKLKYARQPNEHEGYGNDIIFTEDQRLDWTDRIYLKVQPQDQRNFKLWPEKPKDFRNILLEYTERLKLLNEVILKAMAKSLNLEEESFLNQCGERQIMLDKEVEGLQILKDNQWFKVPIIAEALVVNVGEQIEIMSNGIFKSPIHRVVINSEKERQTVAMFFTPDAEKEVVPDNELVNESRPRLYTSVKNYAEIYFKYYQQGKRAIDAAKI